MNKTSPSWTQLIFFYIESLNNAKSVFEESTSKFYENIRNLVDSMKIKLQSLLEEKKGTEELFQKAFSQMLLQTERASQKILDQYFYVKKLRVRSQVESESEVYGKNQIYKKFYDLGYIEIWILNKILIQIQK